MDRGAEDSVTRPRRGLVTGLLLAAILALAAWLRFDDLGSPSFWLDEILGQLHVERARASIAWWQWLTGFHPEHGPLYFATEIWAWNEATARMAPALFGLVSVAVVWVAMRELTRGTLAAACAATLLALSPLHVYYSREARPYGLTLLLTSAILLALLRHRVGAAAVVLVLMAYTSTATASVIGTAAVAAAILWLAARGTIEGKRSRTIALLAIGVAPLFLFLYQPGGVADPPVQFPGVDVSLFDRVIRGISVTVLDSSLGGRTAYALLGLAIVGAIDLVWRHRERGAVVLAFTILPAVFSLSALWSVDHWYAVRYISPSVIGFMMLAGAGIAALASLPARATVSSRAGTIVSALIAVLMIGAIAVQVWPMAYREPRRKFDWAGLTKTIWTHAKEGDLVLAAEPWSEHALRYYARPFPQKVLIVRPSDRRDAEELTSRFAATWLVTGGFSEDVSVRDWMCRHPLLLASPIENVRVHYAPSASHFLRTRALVPDHRAAAAAAGRGPVLLRFGLKDEGFLGEGWAGAEGKDESLTFRWSTATRATIGVPPVEGATQIRIIAMPLDHPSLPPQTVTPIVGGQRLVTTTLRPGWSEYWFDLPHGALRASWNEIAFEFGRTARPSEIDRNSTDGRLLSAAFYSVAIGPHAFADAEPVRLRPFAPRLASAALLQDAFWDDQSRQRFPPDRLRRETIVPLLGRLGFDPETTWPRIASGEMTIEDVVEVAAYGSDCRDDRTFLAAAGERILDRELENAELDILLREMKQHGYSRPRMAIYIARSDEFREKALVKKSEE